MAGWLDVIVTDAHRRLLDLPTIHPARQYLRSRGVTDAMVARLRVGWLPDPHGVAACTSEYLTWATRYAWDRIVFPLTNALGDAVGLQVRRHDQKGYEDFQAVPSEVSPLCFGLHVALPAAFRSERLIVVEGVFDYFAVLPYADDVIAILTSSASLAVRRLLGRYAKTVVCLTDMDAPGRRGAYKLAGLACPPEFLSRKDSVTPRLKLPPYHVVMPSYGAHDPDELRSTGRVDELRRLTDYGLKIGVMA